MANKQKLKGGSKKCGRSKLWCEAYKSRNQREKNKSARLKSHLIRHPTDTTAVKALDLIPRFMQG